MNRTAIILAALIANSPLAQAKDNNPFSGATSISVAMSRDKPMSIFSPLPDGQKNRHRPFRLHCTLDGKPMVEWRGRAGQYRIKLDGEWSDVPADAAGPMMLLLWAGGAECVRR